MLIILSKPPKNENHNSILNLAAKLAEKGDKIAVLHMQDACAAATLAEYCSKLRKSNIDVYAVEADVEAQDLKEKTHPSVKIIDYTRWVSLLIDEHKKTVSWTS